MDPAKKKVIKRMDSKLLGSLPTKRDPYDRIEIQSKVTRRVADYVKDGVTCLRDVISPDQLNALRQAANQTIDNPGQHRDKVKSIDGSSVMTRDYGNWLKRAGLKDFITESLAGFMVCTLMEARYVSFYLDVVENKAVGHFPTQEKWKQDQSISPIDGDKVCCMWICLESVPIANCPRFVKGSHQWGQWFFPSKSNKREFLKYIREYNGYVGRIYENPPDQLDEKTNRIFQTEIAPGDVIIYHSRLLTSLAPNDYIPRKSISLKYAGDDATFANRPWPPHPPITGGLTPGVPFFNETFPKVYDDLERRLGDQDLLLQQQGKNESKNGH